jgi:D-alanyl-D-alanine dipeptidase
MKRLLFIFFTIFIFQNCQEPVKKNQSEEMIQRTILDTIVKPSPKIEKLTKDTLKDTVTITPLPVNPKPIPKEKKPKSSAIYNPKEWTEVTDLDASILLDLRYATTNNFMEEKVYECGRCFLRPKVAKAIVKAHQELQKQDFGLKIFDCYRPRPIQWKLWNKVPNPKYVADPRKGSMHNRGSAIDLTIVDENGEQLDMGTAYDYFGKKGWTFYKELPEAVLNNRKLLRETLAKYELKHIKTEWWHFAYRSKRYSISDFVWACED